MGDVSARSQGSLFSNLAAKEAKAGASWLGTSGCGEGCPQHLG